MVALELDMFPDIARVNAVSEKPRLIIVRHIPDSERAGSIFQEILKAEAPKIGFTDISSDFRAWFHNTSERDRRQIAALLVYSGEASNELEAYEKLNNFLRDNPLEQAKSLTVGDIEGTSRPHLKPKMNEWVGIGKRDLVNITAWNYGTMGHAAIPDLFKGNLVDFSKMGIAELAQIIKLDSKANPKSFLGQVRWLNKTIKNGLDRNRGSVSAIDRKYVGRLYHLLKPIYKGHMDKISEYPPLGLENYALTLMCWVSGLEFALENPNRVLFPETPILPFEQDVWGGRPDALEVTSINGLAPNSQQTKMLETLSKHNFLSFVELFKYLYKLFGDDIQMKPIDWKMGIGDGSPAWRPIDKDKTPLRKHPKQIQRYLTFLSVAWILAKNGNLSGDWPGKSPFTQGDLVYMLPGERPVKHTIKFSEEEQEEYLRSFLARRYSKARSNSKTRIVQNKVNNYIASFAERREPRPNLQVVDPNYTYELPWDQEHAPEIPSVVKFLDRYRDYEDKHGILEITQRKDGEKSCTFHLDKLFEAIRKGQVKPRRGFSFKRGGFIPCLFEDHDEKTGSMYVQIQKGMAHCFGVSCGKTVYFAEGSIPPEVESDIKISSFKGGRNSKEGVIVSEERLKIAATAQEIMQMLLRKTPNAQIYITDKRCIDLDLAKEFGAGYASLEFLDEILASGIKFEELKAAGFIGYADRPDVTGGLSQYSRSMRESEVLIGNFLKRHGLELEDVVEVEQINPQFFVTKYPYFVLYNRITFPLDWGAFYGRAIWEAAKKRELHRKTIGLAGAFAINRLTPNVKLSNQVEGVWEVLSHEQLGFPSGAVNIGLVGTHSEAIMAKILSFKPESLGFGLDNDKGGIIATVKHIEWAREMGYTGPIINTTQEFLEEYPSAKAYDDTNSYLQAVRRGEI